jgi:hypothetical protein
MKQPRLFHLLFLVLVMVTSTYGCRTAPPPAVTNNLDDLIRNASNLARQHADEALAAKIAAEAAEGDELLLLLRQADEAAQQSRQYANEAASLQNQINDLAIQNQVSDDVSRAVQAADEARNAVDAVLILRRVIYKSQVDQISENIIANTVRIDDEAFREPLKEVINQAFCFTLASALVGQFPPREAIQNEVEERARFQGVPLSDPAWNISAAIEADASNLINRLHQAQAQEEMEGYQDMCNDLLSHL